MYLVLELQKNGEQIASIITKHNSIRDAESKFYTVLAAAAVSTVPLHSASLLTERGELIKNESYEHIILEEVTE